MRSKQFWNPNLCSYLLALEVHREAYRSKPTREQGQAGSGTNLLEQLAIAASSFAYNTTNLSWRESVPR